jgi:hypothetical protein
MTRFSGPSLTTNLACVWYAPVTFIIETHHLLPPPPLGRHRVGAVCRLVFVHIQVVAPPIVS